MTPEMQVTTSERAPHRSNPLEERRAEARALRQQVEQALRSAPFEKVAVVSSSLERKLEILSEAVLALEGEKAKAKQAGGTVDFSTTIREIEAKEQVATVIELQALVNRVIKERSIGGES